MDLTTPSFTWGADCIAENAHLLPLGIPVLWPYCTGTPGVRWNPWQVTRLAPGHVIWVNQGYQSPSPFDGDEFDVESGGWQVSDAPGIAGTRRDRQVPTKFYVTWSLYGQVKGILADSGITTSVFYRIADWNLNQHMADAELHGDVYAGQWASPTSNPDTLFPGTEATLTQMGADLNVYLPVNTGWQG